MSGLFQSKGTKNQNGRVYPDEVLIREVDKYIKNFVNQRRAVGELDHPESSVVSLKNASHNITEMHWQGDDLIGTIEVLTTPNGNILRELFRNRINVGISSRGLGTLKNIGENTTIVQDDFELVAFDFVSNPSVLGAFMHPVSEKQLNEGVVYNTLTNRWNSCERLVGELLECISNE